MAADEPQKGDRRAAGDDIKSGDLVYWGRGSDGKLMLRRLEESQLATFPDTVFRVEQQGDNPQSLVFRPVKWADHWCTP